MQDLNTTERSGRMHPGCNPHCPLAILDLDVELPGGVAELVHVVVAGSHNVMVDVLLRLSAIL